MARFKVIIILLPVLLKLTACGYSEKAGESTEKTKDDTEKVILDGGIVDEIGQCLEEQVPEIYDWGIFVEERSDGQAYLYERYDGEIDEVYKNGEGSEYLGKYYTVYVGEMWEDTLRLRESEFEVYTLEEWRDSSYYPQLDEEK